MTAPLNRPGIAVGHGLDADGELRMEVDGTYYTREDVAALRDHLTAVLGDGPTATPTLTVDPEYGGLTRAEALKLAEETVTRLAPATNARGYSDGTAPLDARMSAILRTARYLMKESE
ncbi:hypothetical protein [Micromonospora sediminicola]|uniref:hypothetical protein n=1 Tax=Micromonospora sediminicola TaxID=946078 RepID=UPI0037A94FD4